MSKAPKAVGPIEIIARVGGQVVTIPVSDLVCVRIDSDGDQAIRILPGVVGRCLALGADALVAEKLSRTVADIAKDCRVEKPSVEQELFGQG